MMSIPLLPENLRTLCEHRCCFAWPDPNVPRYYETETYGAIHLQKKGKGSPDRWPVVPDEKGKYVNQQIWLVQTLFAAPTVWWQHTLVHSGQTVIPLFFHRGRLILGPGYREGGDFCPTCIALRLGQAFPYPHVFKSLLRGPITRTADTSLAPIWALLELDTVAQFAIENLNRFQSGMLASLSLSDGEAGVEWHRVYSLPGSHPFHGVQLSVAALFGIPDLLPWSEKDQGTKESQNNLSKVGGTDQLVGPFLETATVPSQQGEPRDITSAVTVTGHLGHFTGWCPDVSGSGMGFSLEDARWASLGEAAERYSGNYIPVKKLVFASEMDLLARGRAHVSLERFRWFFPEQEATDWPFAPLRREDCIPWIAAQPLHSSGQEVLVPSELAYLNLTRITGEQSRFPVPLAGIAAHRSREQAELSAMLELFERDASMLWWHGGLPARQIGTLPRSLEDQFNAGVPSTIRQWFLFLETDLPAFVVAGCLHDRKNQILVLGFAARFSLADALRKAIAEAWQLRRLSLQLLNPQSDLWQDIALGRFPLPTRPYRSDRRYRESFREDYGDMHQLAYNLQYYLDPSLHESALARLTGETVPYTSLEKKRSFDAGAMRAQCITAFGQLGMDAYSVDLTTADMKELGFSTVRVVAPGLVGNTPTAFLPLAHPRLRNVLSQTGLSAYRGPLPHA